MAERRRGYGEGAIYQLADGRWQGSVELGWISGARRRRTITRNRKSDVARDLRKLLASVEDGQLRHERSPTVERSMETYLREVASTRVRPVTLDSYEQLVRLHINPEIGRHRLDRLRPQHVAALYRQLGLTLAPSSVRRVHAVLRRALTVAVRWGRPTALREPSRPDPHGPPPALERRAHGAERDSPERERVPARLRCG